MKPLNLAGVHMFGLTLMFDVIGDPIGIGFILGGVTWIFNRKLAYLEAILIFFLKGGFQSVTALPGGLVWMPGAIFGLLWSTAIVGERVNNKLKTKSPDLWAMLK